MPKRPFDAGRLEVPHASEIVADSDDTLGPFPSTDTDEDEGKGGDDKDETRLRQGMLSSEGPLNRDH